MRAHNQYLAELVRYIHLNSVRAKMVRRARDFHYSSHRAYLRLDEARVVDAEPVLRHFGAGKKLARERFALFVRAGMKLGHREEFYRANARRASGAGDPHHKASGDQVLQSSVRVPWRQALSQQ